VKPLAATLGVARSNLAEQDPTASTGRRECASRMMLLPLIGVIVAERASYGYRR
jgi:hypothetical protein